MDFNDFSWAGQRAAGVFLHITSLPSDFGIGNIGSASDAFFDFLEKADFKYWQICPLGPTGYGDSPYQSFSAFAGNIYFIDYTRLVDAGLLENCELDPFRSLPKEFCDYGAIYSILPNLLRKAYSNFLKKNDKNQTALLKKFSKKNSSWLDSYALYTALKKKFNSVAWTQWPQNFRDYSKEVVQKLDDDDIFECDCVKFGQWIFFSQFEDFKKKAKQKNIEIFGDLPIFLAADSADVWANPDLFELSKNGSPINVAGVGPDYFSQEGQLWGNPLYDWKGQKNKVFDFWKSRVEQALAMYDVVRLDHFRGFADYWSIPAKLNDARLGKWKLGPGVEFFKFIKENFPTQKFVAEDLGLLSKRAVDLRKNINMPGMAVLQFAFGSSPDNPYLPHNIDKDCIYYTGTHDNNTAVGWYQSASEKEKDEFRKYFRTSDDSPNWTMIHAVMTSVAKVAIFPMQDILGVGADCRTNTPGKPSGNWAWRLLKWQLDLVISQNLDYIKELIFLSSRSKKDD